MAKPRTALERQKTGTMHVFRSAVWDWLIIHLPFLRFFNSKYDFVFLVHPRTDKVLERDVYGRSDVFKQFPMLEKYIRDKAERRKKQLNLAKEEVEEYARGLLRSFLRVLPPLTLATITVEHNGVMLRGKLITASRLPSDLRRDAKHKRKILALVRAYHAKYLGLGALWPSKSDYGRDFEGINRGLYISTGHANTGYVIVEFLNDLFVKRESAYSRPRVAMLGAAGSTGIATLRAMEFKLSRKIDLVLIDRDIAEKQTRLAELADELSGIGTIEYGSDHAMLKSCDYVIVVTASPRALVRPEHIKPGAVIIDDSQPRNTSKEVLNAGCFVLDVLAETNGLKCPFDFGFKNPKLNVGFTCMQEVMHAAATGAEYNRTGEVTRLAMQRAVQMNRQASVLGLPGELPYYSFGKPMDGEQLARLFAPRVVVVPETMNPAAE